MMRLSRPHDFEVWGGPSPQVGTHRGLSWASGSGSESFCRDDESMDRSKDFSIVGYMALGASSQEQVHSGIVIVKLCQGG